MPKEKTEELPAMTGKGVEVVKIPELEKAISKYQKKKEERCNASPGEIAAKQELQELMHKNRERLPLNADGLPFYRCDDRDYILEEKLKTKKVESDGEADD
jgi:hypothetical protein